MTIDISLHKTILFQILKDLYTDTRLAPFLGFKGGTAAFMFYGLDRFSVDLDFDLLDEERKELVFDLVQQILQKYGTLKETHSKRFSLFFLLSYGDQAHNIKVEINCRQFGSRYEIKTYLGVSMQVMVLEDMFAHKLVALTERVGKTSRDVYDVWFFLHARYPLNKSIVEKRTNLDFNAFIRQCVSLVEQVKDRHILDGLGELLTLSQKDWAKAKLRSETCALLLLRLEEG
jgi:predicted nucleotidyltransferase component of viral defense system